MALIPSRSSVTSALAQHDRAAAVAERPAISLWIASHAAFEFHASMLTINHDPGGRRSRNEIAGDGNR